ncbi:hypothetical protein [Actinoallomurus sp. NPDC050550]|uniref:hypothetical protein n=1 Tax=Actinoallomurus sp. NPDC050550 TaxID=3154937 RepID=UPI0033E60D8F
MSSVKERLRKLYANGCEFTWTGQICHVAGERDCHRCIRVRVWGAGKNSSALQADLLSKAVLPWGCATDCNYPTPKDVRTVIDYALAHGWDPHLIGGTFFLSESGHASAFELADFLLTDRLRDEGAPDPTTRVFRAFDENPIPPIPAPSVKPSPED